MLRILFLIFVLYLAYKIIFDFIIPVSKTASSVKTKIKQMQEDQMRSQHAASASAQTASAKTSKEGDYIDFEEIK